MTGFAPAASMAPNAGQVVSSTTSPGLADLQGLWTRSLIAWPDGRQDTTTKVVWLQGKAGYIDLRQPVDLPGFASVRCLNDLTWDDCRALAAQQGFAGTLREDGPAFVWERELDYQPAEPTPDSGFLAWQGATLVETGRHQPYVEHWHREAAASDEGMDLAQPHGWQAPDGVLLRLSERGARSSAMALRVGPYFMFAQAAAFTAEVKGASTLAEAVERADTLHAARALVACEISFGRLRGSGGLPVILRSTLPWRVGCSFHLSTMAEGTLATPGQDADGRLCTQLWDVHSPLSSAA
ncbi:hypothetical protein [Acetobacter peroxydans]|uniref:Uncharacterized protein n=1 Tax=Acetobacter peroxydans TaxID=104098 RepID=A0A4Y3TXK3_9PROT|nr:hypothetical protein [Acetobacter peroxydans]NHO16618.1 hypothetical protein [Acetobacter peroxydans]GBR39002.1 hypothetical protein AA0475_0012 [Acetobacter peroxydans]GEB85485.1 hypothetical protein APE01nite_12820 [Acetobacter peroxydans]